MRKIKLINGKDHEIVFKNDSIKEHFENRKNCTIEIINQINAGLYLPLIDERDRIILDIGANIGLFSTHVSPYAEKIIAVEPTPSHFEILKNITGGFGNVFPENCCLSDHDGFENFYISECNSTTNSLIKNIGVEVKVKSYTLRSIIEKYNLKTVNFCKIDIEGSEIIALNEQVIKYMSEKISKIFIEFHSVNGLTYTQQRSNYSPIFNKYGYKMKDISVDALFCYK